MPVVTLLLMMLSSSVWASDRSDYNELASHELRLPSGVSGWVYTLDELQDPTALSIWYGRRARCRGLSLNSLWVRYKDPIINDPAYDPEWQRLEATAVRGTTKYIAGNEFNEVRLYIAMNRTARCTVSLMASDPAEADYFEAIIRVVTRTCDDDTNSNGCKALVERLDQDEGMFYEVDEADNRAFNLQTAGVYRVEAYVATMQGREVMRILSATLIQDPGPL